MKTRGQPHSSSVIYQWGRISHWLLSCLVSMCNHTWMVTWVLEIKFRSLWLHGKHLTDWTISPVPSCIMIFLYKALSSSLYQHTGECILVASMHKKQVHPSLYLPLFILSPPPMSFSPNELRTVKQLVLSIPLHVTLCLLMPKVDENMVSFLSYLYRSNKSQEEPKIKSNIWKRNGVFDDRKFLAPSSINCYAHAVIFSLKCLAILLSKKIAWCISNLGKCIKKSRC